MAGPMDTEDRFRAKGAAKVREDGEEKRKDAENDQRKRARERLERVWARDACAVCAVVGGAGIGAGALAAEGTGAAVDALRARIDPAAAS